MRLRSIPVVLLALHLATLGVAQQLAEPPKRDPKAPAPEALAKLMLEAGRAALADKQPGEGVRHFANALWYDPFNPAMLGNLLEASVSDPDAFALWMDQAIAATMDEKGAPALDEKWRKRLAPVDAWAPKCAILRAEAVAELAVLVHELQGKGREGSDHPHLARWAAATAIDLARGSPSLVRRDGGVFTAAFVPPLLPDHRVVLGALKEVMDKYLGEQKAGEAVRVAQCLLGFAAQAGFKDADGPKAPDLTAVGMAARAGLQRARAQFDAARKDPSPTIAQLEAMTPEEQEAFTREHATFANPGVTYSPNKLYRVETICGHATLLGVAKTVEFHHARLAGWFGKDPFNGQQGIVRIVPESAGLENEGSPHWWAGGFQGGSVTTLKFSCGTIAGLGRGLTHELTHRFDGALHGGIPAWLVEGRAVWTGGSYGPPSDPKFVPNHLSFGTVEDAFIKGYGGEDRLKKLVEGTIEDYRHNYTAGYALYVYLTQWKEGDKVVFGERFTKFENECRGNGNSLENFVAHFCDGKSGRPKDFKEFAKRFGEFVKGFYWQNRAPWTSQYTEKVPDQGYWPYVYDGPTWHAGRTRAEPWFGQDQARQAGDLLLGAGRKKEAAAAYSWSLLVDDWSVEVGAKLARLYTEANQPAQAWAVLAETARRFPEKTAVPAMPADLKRSTAGLHALYDLLRDAVKTCADGARPACAAALAAERDRLGARFGYPPRGVALPAEAAAKLLHPLDPPAVPLGLLGWEEDRLTDYEERRVKDLWYETADGDLMVGRTKPREGTGETDRYAAQQHAFTRSKQWISAGAYVVRTKIQASTSFVSGAMILGYTRRDRNVRVGFSGGDFLYSIGAKSEAGKFDQINANLWGLRERDGALWGSNPGRGIKLKTPSSTFDLEVFVERSSAEAYINGQLVGTYHTLDGAPIEGSVGFASGQGAYFAKTPTIERRDRSRSAGLERGFPFGLDLAREGHGAAHELINRSARGIPTTRQGTLVVWIPELPSSDDPTKPASLEQLVGETAAVAQSAREAVVAARAPQPLVVVVPRTITDAAFKTLETDLRAAIPNLAAVLIHRHQRALTTKQDVPEQPPRVTTSLLFVDPIGVLRCAEPFEAAQRTLPGGLLHWTTVFGAIARETATPGEK